MRQVIGGTNEHCWSRAKAGAVGEVAHHQPHVHWLHRGVIGGTVPRYIHVEKSGSAQHSLTSDVHVSNSKNLKNQKYFSMADKECYTDIQPSGPSTCIEVDNIELLDITVENLYKEQPD